MVAQRYVEAAPVAELVMHPRNPRRGNVDVILESIEAHGFIGAVVVQEGTNYVLAGNHRVLAARQAEQVSVPAFYLDVDDRQAEQILLADNRATDVSGYDERALAELLSELQAEDYLGGTGYDAEQALEVVMASGKLAEDATAFLDEDADQASTWSGAGGTPGNPYFTFSVTMSEPERARVRTAVELAKDRLGVETAAEALVAIAEHFIARPPAKRKGSA